VTDSLRVALLLDPLSIHLEEPLSLRVKWGDHAPRLAAELLGRGHVVRGFGAPPGLIPRSGQEVADAAEDGAGPVSLSKLRNFRPDVLVAYDALSPAAARGARMARKLGAALVLVEAALPLEGGALQRSLWQVGEFLWGRYVRRTATALVALDAIAREQALREGFAADLIRVVPHGVDLNQFRPGLTSTIVARNKIRGRILLYTGRLVANRGLEVLMAAFARTVGQRADWTLVLAGDGSAKPRLRAMADRLGVADRVHWIARPRTEELPGLLGASTLYAVPARESSVTGRSVARALACGLPVIASDLPRFHDLIQHQHSGLLIKPGDVEAWTEAIRWASGSPMARKRWGVNAREFATSNLDWNVVAQRFEEIFGSARERVRAKLAEKARRSTPLPERRPS